MKKYITEILIDLLGVAGFIGIVYGTHLLNKPAAYIVGGVILFALALVAAKNKGN